MRSTGSTLSWLVVAAVAFGAVGCGNHAASTTASASATSSVASAPSASASADKPSWGPAPSAARRDSAPAGIQTSALAEGSIAPDFTLPGTTGNWSLTEGLSKTTYVVLVFYRGAW